MRTFISVPAAELDAFFTSRKFTRCDDGRTERTYERAGKGCASLRIVVWSSVPPEGGETRGCGEDAIRVALMAVVAGGRRWGLHKCKRIHRTGSVEKVVARLLERIKEAAEAAKEYGPACPRCAAPTYADSGRCIVRDCRAVEPAHRVSGPCITCGAATYADSGRCTVRACRDESDLSRQAAR
jgi:hypothetical protein